MVAWSHGRLLLVLAFVFPLIPAGSAAQITVFLPQGVQVSAGRTAASSGNSSNCQIACAATALSNLFGQGTPGGEADPTDPITLFLALQEAFGSDPENSDSVATATSSQGDSLSGDSTGNGFGVTTYGDVQDPDGGPAGGPTPPTSGIGSNESMILLADFPNFGHAYLLQGISLGIEWKFVKEPPPWDVDVLEPVVNNDGDIIYWGLFYTLKVYDPIFSSTIDVLLSLDGEWLYDEGINSNASGSYYGHLGGGIRLTRNTP